MIVKAGPPVIAVAGDKELIVGRGLLLFPFPSEPLLLQPENINETIMTLSNLNNFIVVIFLKRECNCFEILFNHFTGG